MIEWILYNKEWLFSGIGVFVLSVIGFIVNHHKQNRAQKVTQEMLRKITEELKQLNTTSKAMSFNSEIQNIPSHHTEQKIRKKFKTKNIKR